MRCEIDGDDCVGVRETPADNALSQQAGSSLTCSLYQLQKQVPMRNMLSTTAAAALIAISSSVAFAQSPSTFQPTNGATRQPSYGSASPQTGYGDHLTGARALGQPSLTKGIPYGNQPSASRHLDPG